jgi:hypothetical protein
VQRSPTDCDVSVCVIKIPREWGGPGPLGAVVPKNIIIIIIIIIIVIIIIIKCDVYEEEERCLEVFDRDTWTKQTTWSI